MPLKFYQSFNLNERELSELFCAECTKDGNSVDVLNYCLGCESLFCYQCLQDHTREEEKFYLPGEDVTISKQEDGPEYTKIYDGYTSNNNNNRRALSNKATLLRETKYKLLPIKRQLLKQLEKNRTQQECHLQSIFEDVEKKLTVLRTNINKLLEDLEHNIFKELKQYHHELEMSLMHKETPIKILLEKVDASLAYLTKVNARSDIEEITKFAKQVIREARDINEDPDRHFEDEMKRAARVEQENAEIILNNCIDEFLCNVNVLGRDFLTNGSNTRLGNSACNSYDIHVPTDTRTCDINGSCIMPDGTILLADWNNSNIKRLDHNYHVTEICDLPGIPWAVCCSNETEAVVSLHFLQRIQFISFTNDKMALTDSFKVKQKCRGVACANDKIFIACGGSDLLETGGQILTYSRKGALLETFAIDNTGYLSSVPQHIAINSDGTMLYVADKELSLVIIDLEQKLHIVNKTEVSNLEEKRGEAKGVCLMDDSNILVCDFIKNMVALNRNIEGPVKGIKNILDETDTVKNPQSLSYNMKNSTLIVSSGNSDFIQVFTLEF